MEEPSRIAKRMDGELPRALQTLPRLPYGVEPVPGAHGARSTPPAATSGAPKDEHRGGDLLGQHLRPDERPLYDLQALILHEAVPGHHLQIALAQELDDLPAFRQLLPTSPPSARAGGSTPSAWALEAGFYTGPVLELRPPDLRDVAGLPAGGRHRPPRDGLDPPAGDRLHGRTHRAVRSTRSTTEIDRYIAWPGQALAYKIGEIEIRAPAGQGRKGAGHRFDVREFHDAVLLHGSVPLPVLAENVERWIAAEKAE